MLVAALRYDRPAVEVAWSVLEEIPEHPALVMGTEIERAAAWRKYVLGDHDAAFSILRTAADDAARQGSDSLAMAALHDLIRLGAPIEMDFWNSVRPVQGELAATRIAFAEAVTRSDPAGLIEVADRFEAMGTPLFAAEAHVVAARLYRKGGAERSATQHSRVADTLCDAADENRVLTVNESTSSNGLTERESEVAGLAADGTTNQDVAAQLFISVRTVENHLQRVYSKLGVRRRSDLTEIL